MAASRFYSSFLRNGGVTPLTCWLAATRYRLPDADRFRAAVVFFDNCIEMEGVRWRRPMGEALRVSVEFSWLMVGWFGSGFLRPGLSRLVFWDAALTYLTRKTVF